VIDPALGGAVGGGIGFAVGHSRDTGWIVRYGRPE
jgi:hypothetical protein